MNSPQRKASNRGGRREKQEASHDDRSKNFEGILRDREGHFQTG